MESYRIVISIILLHCTALWLTTTGTCDVSVCPYICSGLGCPKPADAAITVDPTGPPVSCQEVIIETIGYPHGYPGEMCEWKFDSSPTTSTYSATILDFDGAAGDTLHAFRRFVLGNGNIIETNLFNGDADALNAIATNEFAHRGHMLIVTYTPSSISYKHRGARLRIMFAEEDATQACSATQDLSLSDAMPAGAILTPNHNINYGVGSLCYYHITSPTGSQIYLEFLGNMQIEANEDFVFVYDVTDSANPELLRIFSFGSSRPFDGIDTGTNDVQIVFMDNAANVNRGFFMRLTFVDAAVECSGTGTNNDQCICDDVAGGSRCQVDGATDFTVIPTPTSAADFTEACSVSGTTVRLQYASESSNVVLGSPTYFTGSGAPMGCEWTIVGPTASYLAIIFRDFQLELAVDGFEIRYLDQRFAFGHSMYSSNVVNLPVTRAGTTLPLIGTPIILDSNRVRLTYAPQTSDVATYPGPIFEVHVLGKDTCTEPCLNGGRCDATCTCDPGRQGAFCEQDTPPDYTCLVKNPYVTPHFAYPVILHAIAGTNTFTSDDFTFDLYGPASFDGNLPSNAIITQQDYGNVLTLPSDCDQKETSTRFGALSCIFEGDGFIDPVVVPVIVNPKSDFLSPVGRVTKTVSIGDPSVTLSVEHLPSKQDGLRWRFNGAIQQQWNGMSSITIQNIAIEDGGIYECFIRGENGVDYDKVTYRLIARECPDGTYGPTDCIGTCPACQNGGTCSDVYGTCICPPGYAGDFCETLLTRHTVSRNTALTCNGLGISTNGCKGLQFCLPDPAGCMCMSGWTGSDCQTPCDPLKFGRECLFDCHCDSGDQCDVATGACPNGCAATYTGDNCQIVLTVELTE